ncbi:MAG: anti-sigma factor family protein [Gemmatimonadaceae bacterium]
MTDKTDFRAAMRDAFPNRPAPEQLRVWAADLGRTSARGAPRTQGVKRMLYAAGLVIALGAGWGGHSLVASLARGSSSDVAMADELVDSHVRSLMADHLMDVQSTDQHTVKPLFIGKADFAPQVTDLATAGFPLLGGRLDHIGGHTAAALVFGRRKHVINVYEWPASSADGRVVREQRSGYALLHWTANGLSFWAVTDAAPADLDEFRRAYTPGR